MGKGAEGYGGRTGAKIRAMRLRWGGKEAIAEKEDENAVSDTELEEAEEFSKKARRLKKLQRELNTNMAEDQHAMEEHDVQEKELKEMEVVRRDQARREKEFAHLGR